MQLYVARDIGHVKDIATLDYLRFEPLARQPATPVP